MRKVWILTEEERWRFDAYLKSIAEAAITMRELAEAMYKAGLAAITLKDTMKIAKK